MRVQVELWVDDIDADETDSTGLTEEAFLRLARHMSVAGFSIEEVRRT